MNQYQEYLRQKAINNSQIYNMARKGRLDLEKLLGDLRKAYVYQHPRFPEGRLSGFLDYYTHGHIGKPKFNTGSPYHDWLETFEGRNRNITPKQFIDRLSKHIGEFLPSTYGYYPFRFLNDYGYKHSIPARDHYLNDFLRSYIDSNLGNINKDSLMNYLSNYKHPLGEEPTNIVRLIHTGLNAYPSAGHTIFRDYVQENNLDQPENLYGLLGKEGFDPHDFPLNPTKLVSDPTSGHFHNIVHGFMRRVDRSTGKSENQYRNLLETPMGSTHGKMIKNFVTSHLFE